MRLGRLVFQNLQKVISYLLPAGSWSEIWPVILNVWFGVPLPLSAFLMIIICVFTDLFLSLSLIMEKEEFDLLSLPPRNHKRDHLINAKTETADQIAAVIRDITGGEGVDASLEMSGNPTALHQAFSAVKNGGRVTLFGIPTGPINCDLANEIIFKGIRVYGITGRRLFKTWYRLTGLFQAGLNIKPVITHTFPMTDFARGFELINSGQCGKVVLLP